jgi:hypothetical protein
MMVRPLYPVEHRIAHVDVARGHVDARPQHVRAVGKLARAHPPEQIEVLLHRAVAERTVGAGLGQRAAVAPHVIRRLAVDIRLPYRNQVDGVLVELLEIVGREVQAGPLESEPADVFLD